MRPVCLRLCASLLFVALGCSNSSDSLGGSGGTGGRAAGGAGGRSATGGATVDAGCLCPLYLDRVCGVDGRDYGSACFASCAGVDVAYWGPCAQDGAAQGGASGTAGASGAGGSGGAGGQAGDGGQDGAPTGG